MGQWALQSLTRTTFFLRGLIKGTVTAKVLSFRNRREKEDRIGESQPFRERTLYHQDKILPGQESNLRPSAYTILLEGHCADKFVPKCTMLFAEQDVLH
jgi:hypothetical protein